MLRTGDGEEVEEVARFRYIVITGPEDGGQGEVVKSLQGQVLRLDQMAEDGDRGRRTQSSFESRIFFSLRWRFSADKEVHF